MKKLFSLAIAIATPILLFSCAQETEDIIEDFKPVTVSLNTVMKVNDMNTKAEQFPINLYELDYIYLMVSNGTDFDPYMIDLKAGGIDKQFNLRVTSIVDGKIMLQSDGIDLVTVEEGQQMYFSSHKTCDVETVIDPAKTTPSDSAVYKPYGQDLYKSQEFNIELIEGGFRIMDVDYLANQNNSLDLLMFRLTGSFRAKVIFFRQENPEIPLGVTETQWTDELGALENWTVTPYLREYYSQFKICVGEKGLVQGSADATYMLSDGGCTPVFQPVTVFKDSEVGIPLETYAAGITENYFPYLFNGDISKSIISFAIKNNAVNQEASLSVLIADVKYDHAYIMVL